MHVARCAVFTSTLLALLLSGGCAHRPATPASPLQQAWQDVRSAGGTLIDSDAALQHRLAALDRFAVARRQAQREAQCADHPNPALCMEQGLLDRIMVTGSRISSADVITNNQESGIDEGGIVKKTGDHLVVLRKGTLYSIALREAGRDSLMVVDRLLAAEDDSGRGVWYDEILALDGRIVLLGYGGGSQLIGFDLDAEGRLHRRWHYTLTSNDYFSGQNYGMRLHGDRLVFKQSLGLSLGKGMSWPTWRLGGEPAETARSLVAEHQILLPGLVSEHPDLHLVLSCPLPMLDAGRFECDARGVVSDGESELYVAESAAYLALSAWDDELYLDPQFNAWGWSPRLSPEQLQAHRQTWLVRFPLARSGPPDMARLRGELHSQFWLKELGGDLHAISSTGYDDDAALLLHRVRDRDFAQADEAIMTPRRSLPGHARGPVRLTERAAYVVRATDTAEQDQPGVSLAVLGLQSDSLTHLDLDFWPSRLEPALGHLVATGNDGRDELRFALLPDHAAPRILDQIGLAGYRESEYLSHAFNAGRPAAGRVVFGLPVVPSIADSSDGYDRTEQVSDMLLIDMSDSRLRYLGLVDMATQAQPELDCELSCVDWYGNARLFFVGDRIFALSADQLAELRLRGNALQEVARIRLVD